MDVTLDNLSEMVAKLDEKLQAGVVQFVYRKSSDGTLRTAFGTLKFEVVNKTFALKAANARVELLQEIYVGCADGGSVVIEKGNDLYNKIEKSLMILTPGPSRVESMNKSYFDIEVGEWRSYPINNLVKVYL